MPQVTASEKGRGQTESFFERGIEMWWGLKPKCEHQSVLERTTLESDSLVDVNIWYTSKSNVSWIGGMNMAGLTANPKHKLKSDSVLVPWGKAEKYP